MERFECHRNWLAVFFAVVLILLTSFLIIPSVRAGEPAQETEAYCLGCHNNPDLSLELPSGETLSLFISPEILGKSIHSPLGIECEACHTQITTYPHPKLDYQSRRELARAYYQACQKCHSDNYTKTLDSMHAQAANAGNLNAPICTDCHGAHDVQKPDKPRANISTTCGQCHTAIFAARDASTRPTTGRDAPAMEMVSPTLMSNWRA